MRQGLTSRPLSLQQSVSHRMLSHQLHTQKKTLSCWTMMRNLLQNQPHLSPKRSHLSLRRTKHPPPSVPAHSKERTSQTNEEFSHEQYQANREIIKQEQVDPEDEAASTAEMLVRSPGRRCELLLPQDRCPVLTSKLQSKSLIWMTMRRKL